MPRAPKVDPVDPRFAAADAAESAAAAGKPWAVKAIADGTVDRLRGINPDRPDPLPGHVAAAMIAAGLLAFRLGEADTLSWIERTFPEGEKNGRRNL